VFAAPTGPAFFGGLRLAGRFASFLRHLRLGVVFAHALHRTCYELRCKTKGIIVARSRVGCYATRMAAQGNATESVTIRLTPGERAAMEQLAQRRAAEMEAQDIPGDATFAGWLRWIIRREARAAGIVVEGVTAATPVTPEPVKRNLKRGRGK
jgi:hypothetical protein